MMLYKLIGLLLIAVVSGFIVYAIMGVVGVREQGAEAPSNEVSADIEREEVSTQEVDVAPVDVGKDIAVEVVVPQIDYAPNFTLRYLDRPSEVFTLSDFRGEKPVIVDFFAEHCPNCRRNLPKMEVLEEKYGDLVEVILIGIDSESATKRYFENRPTTLPLVMQDSRVARKYGVRFTNTKALINRDGSLRTMLHGKDITEEHFLSLIEG